MVVSSEDHQKLIDEYKYFFEKNVNPEHPRILDTLEVHQKITNGDKIILHGKKRKVSWVFYAMAFIFICLVIGALYLIGSKIGFLTYFDSIEFLDLFLLIVLIGTLIYAAWAIKMGIKFTYLPRSYFVVGSEGFLHHFGSDTFFHWADISDIKVKNIYAYRFLGYAGKLKLYGVTKKVIKVVETELIDPYHFKLEGSTELEKNHSAQKLFQKIFFEYWRKRVDNL